MEAILKIKGLKSYYYSGQNVIPAVDGVDLDIYPGEIVGIVGESGCGKSTVVRSLMGLLDPVSVYYCSGRRWHTSSGSKGCGA